MSFVCRYINRTTASFKPIRRTTATLLAASLAFAPLFSSKIARAQDAPTDAEIESAAPELEGKVSGVLASEAVAPSDDDKHSPAKEASAQPPSSAPKSASGTPATAAKTQEKNPVAGVEPSVYSATGTSITRLDRKFSAGVRTRQLFSIGYLLALPGEYQSVEAGAVELAARYRILSAGNFALVPGLSYNYHGSSVSASPAKDVENFGAGKNHVFVFSPGFLFSVSKAHVLIEPSIGPRFRSDQVISADNVANELRQNSTSRVYLALGAKSALLVPGVLFLSASVSNSNVFPREVAGAVALPLTIPYASLPLSINGHWDSISFLSVDQSDPRNRFSNASVDSANAFLDIPVLSLFGSSFNIAGLLGGGATIFNYSGNGRITDRSFSAGFGINSRNGNVNLLIGSDGAIMTFISMTLQPELGSGTLALPVQAKMRHLRSRYTLADLGTSADYMRP